MLYEQRERSLKSLHLRLHKAVELEYRYGHDTHSIFQLPMPYLGIVVTAGAQQ